MSVFYVSGERPYYSVGRDHDCDLVLLDSYVSRRHLCFRKVTYDVAAVEILGTNGVTLRGKHVNKGYKGFVRAGDCVVIGCHRIVWTGDYENLRDYPASAAGYAVCADIGPVEIEGPPPRRIPEKPSIMLAAGPALTMAIPILLGAARSVAILSSLFAAAWAVANVLARLKKQRTEEKRRKNTYLSYLLEREKEIKEKLDLIRKFRFMTWPEAGDYLKDGMDPRILWNRGFSDDGSMCIRTGIGAVEAPLDIVIPKERFACIDDSLKDMPRLLKDKYASLSSVPVTTVLDAGSVYGTVLEDENDRRMLAAVLMQLAAGFSPDVLRITAKLGRKLMRYYMWIMLIPHYCPDDDADTPDVRRVLVTDDTAAAYASVATGNTVILAKDAGCVLPPGVLPLAGSNGGKTVRSDMLPLQLCYSHASQLSRLWGNRAVGSIPDSVPFGELTGGCINAGTILEAYEKCDTSLNLKAPIGIGEAGRIVYLDLHEKAAGPHGLIAGTTGSGKSELLTTMILSFAMNCPPDKLAFFLIDYKGGGMSNLFCRLPHVIGNISNLSEADTQRALIALRSENIRRQQAFADAKVNNINDYTHLYDEGRIKEPLPHILIIVDEFAELRRKEPEFMDALISISQVGRSLGMHLIMATQKPAGVVDDRIRANSRFRIALRLVDRSDSMDMLQKPDAVNIKECGRAVLQVGNDEVYECFQSGYAMGSADADEEPRIYEDWLLDEEVKIGMDGRDPPGAVCSWYEKVMGALKEADERTGLKKPGPLWLPPLPEDIYDDSAFAVIDDPYMRSYIRPVYDPGTFGHVWIAGRSGSGKSELLRTLINRLCGKSAVYIIDYGGGTLKSFAGKKYCGAYIEDDHPEDTFRLTLFLNGELTKRRKRKDKDDRNRMILVLDNYTEIVKGADPEAADHLMRIMTLGKSVGIFIIATSSDCPPAREGRLVDTGLVLGSDDPYNTAAFLKTSAKLVPKIKDCPGRGIAVYDDRVLEFQAVRDTGELRSPPGSVTARMYPHVPSDPVLEDVLLRAKYEREYDGLPIGFETKSGRLCCLPTGSVKCILITGKPYSGRHTLLFDISITAARFGIQCRRADTYETLAAICRESTRQTIVMTESVNRILEEFYGTIRSSKEEDELADLFENPAVSSGIVHDGVILVGIIGNDARHKYAGRKVYDSIIRHPYGICLGGSLSENMIFDFSYLPFSQTQMSQKRGFATILRYDENHFHGQVTLPVTNSVDNSQIQ